MVKLWFYEKCLAGGAFDNPIIWPAKYNGGVQSHGFFLCRHELPHDPNDPLNKQNVKDRFDGKNDPVAQKILERIKQQEKDEERERKEVIARCLIKR